MLHVNRDRITACCMLKTRFTNPYSLAVKEIKSVLTPT